MNIICVRWVQYSKILKLIGDKMMPRENLYLGHLEISCPTRPCTWAMEETGPRSFAPGVYSTITNRQQ